MPRSAADEKPQPLDQLAPLLPKFCALALPDMENKKIDKITGVLKLQMCRNSGNCSAIKILLYAKKIHCKLADEEPPPAEAEAPPVDAAAPPPPEEAAEPPLAADAPPPPEDAAEPPLAADAPPPPEEAAEPPLAADAPPPEEATEPPLAADAPPPEEATEPPLDADAPPPEDATEPLLGAGALLSLAEEPVLSDPFRSLSTWGFKTGVTGVQYMLFGLSPHLSLSAHLSASKTILLFSTQQKTSS